MITVSIETRYMKGDSKRSGLICLGCNKRLVFPRGLPVVLYSYIERENRRMVVIDAESGARLHDCRQPLVWMCPTCQVERPCRVYRNRIWAKCETCEAPLEQVDARLIPNALCEVS